MALDSFGQGAKMLPILLMWGSCQKLVTKLCMYIVYVELKKKVCTPAKWPNLLNFSWFLQHKVTRSITTTHLLPGWDASTLQVYPPQHFIRLP